MTDAHDDDRDDERDAGGPASGPEPPASGPTADPRLRPPDPAGTQPKYDPASLLPRQPLGATSRTLWAPPAEGATAGEDEPEVYPRRADEAAAASDDGDVAAPPEYSRYSHRVQFALGALLAVGAAGIVLLVAALVGDSSDKTATVALPSGPSWSTWKPTAGQDAAGQIAEHVGREYRLPDGKQLVGVSGGPMEIAGLPVTIAIQEPVAQGGDIKFVDGTGVLYRMCGVGGTDCGIAAGKPSPNRHMLLRREALELALYSFRYLGVTETVVLLPPGRIQSKSSSGKVTSKKAPPEALLFRRSQPDVQSAVSHPLNATLAPRTPTVNGVTRSPDARLVRAITDTKLFNFRFQEANQDARAFLVLAPLSIR